MTQSPPVHSLAPLRHKLCAQMQVHGGLCPPERAVRPAFRMDERQPVGGALLGIQSVLQPIPATRCGPPAAPGAGESVGWGSGGSLAPR